MHPWKTNKMVIVPASASVVGGLAFTIVRITWTTSLSNFTATTTKETQIQSMPIPPSTTSAAVLTTLVVTTTTPTMSPSTPTTRPLFPRYSEKQIGNADLLKAIDQVDLKLFETLTVVDSISSQTTRPRN